MNRNPKSTKNAPPDQPAAKKPGVPGSNMTDSFATLFQTGLEKVAQVQKDSLDMFAQQSAGLLRSVVMNFRVPLDSPGVIGMTIAGKGIENLVEAHKSLLDMLVQQSALTVEAAKEGAGSASKYVSASAEMLQQAAAKAVEAQSSFVNVAATQNKHLADAVKRQVGSIVNTPVAMAAEAIQRGVNTAIEAQRQFLDAASKPLKSTAAKA